MKQQKKMWRLFEHGPSLSLPSDIERDWLNQFDHSPHKIVTLPPSSTIASNDQRVACMTASKIITLHHASIDDAGIALTTPDQTIKVSCPVSALAMGYAHRFTSPAATAKLTPVVASGHTNGDIYLWNGETSRMMTRLVSHTNTVTQILFSPPANCKKRLMTQIISVSTDRKAKVWDFEDNGYNMSQTISFPSAMHCCAWSSQGGLTAFGGASRKVYIHRKVNHKISKEMVLKLSGHLHNVVSLKFWPDGALLVSASWDARIHIWDSYTGQLKQILSFYHPLPQLLFPSQVSFRIFLF
jgi:WD40 repeat protein